MEGPLGQSMFSSPSVSLFFLASNQNKYIHYVTTIITALHFKPNRRPKKRFVVFQTFRPCFLLVGQKAVSVDYFTNR